MMPALLLSGGASLLVSMLLHAVAPGVADAAGVPPLGWQEAWMTLWPLLFPLFYLASLVVRKARRLAAVRMTRRAGLGFAEIAAVSRQIDAGLGRPVLRGLKPRNDYLA